MKIENMKIEAIKPYPGNAKAHPRDQVNKIAQSIQEYGFQVPILLDKENVIITGHGRLLAAKKLKMESVPTVRMDHLTDAQVRAFRLMDNRSNESDWIPEELAIELKALSLEGFDLELTGFDGQEIERLFELKEGLTDPDDAPPLPVEPVTKPGDVWQMEGENLTHYLICGDCRESSVLDRLMRGAGRAAIIFTDPPYNVDYGATMKDALRHKVSPQNAGRKILNDHFKTNKEFYDFLYKAISTFRPYVSGNVYICMSSSELHTIQKAFADCGGHWSDCIIWAKNTFTIGRANYQRQYEAIPYGWFEKSTHYWSGARNLSDIIGTDTLQYDFDGVPLVRVEPGGIEGNLWEYPKPQKSPEHPTMKPVALAARAIQNSSKRGAVVLDTFGGSGSTLTGCEQTGRSCRLAELDPRYCDVTVVRWENFTGCKAKLIKE
ncbi:MAG: site-specific DNA-methyltransferase [Candidatus Euphemobacter frigidus]|nr:site-specific DNA-methyltransferase [Candidatus Euphemobacter frigidus]